MSHSPFTQKHPGVWVKNDVTVTDFETRHYAHLVGMKIETVQFEEMEGEPVVVLGLVSFNPSARPPAGLRRLFVSVLCDPEGNGPGYLKIFTEDGNEVAP